MSTSLSSLVDNLPEIHKKVCEFMQGKKKKSCQNVDSLILYKCKECNDESYKSINGLNKKFPNTYQFCNRDVNKFVLVLRKGVFPYEYIDSWEKFDETSPPDKEAYYSKINEEGIRNTDYAHTQKVWEVFKIKDNGDKFKVSMFKVIHYCLQMCFKTLEIYELDPAHFLSDPG